MARRNPERADFLRLLNQPAPVSVRSGRHGEPLGVRCEGRMVPVARLRDRWRIDDRWWTEAPVARMYFEIELVNGRVLTLFHDRVAGCWYVQSAGVSRG
jgi:hypothetical protein